MKTIMLFLICIALPTSVTAKVNDYSTDNHVVIIDSDIEKYKISLTEQPKNDNILPSIIVKSFQDRERVEFRIIECCACLGLFILFRRRLNN